VVEEGQVEPVEAIGVGEHVDLDDLPAFDGEAHDRNRPSTPNHDYSCGPVHERRLGEGGNPREGTCTISHTPRTADFPRQARTQETAVRSQHDVRVEGRQQRAEVALTRGT
jgi:hypothetical protein